MALSRKGGPYEKGGSEPSRPGFGPEDLKEAEGQAVGQPAQVADNSEQEKLDQPKRSAGLAGEPTVGQADSQGSKPGAATPGGGSDSLYNPGPAPGRLKRLRGRVLTNRRRLALVGGIATVLIVPLLLFLTLFIPSLKIPQLAANIMQYRMVRVSRTFAREASILSSDRIIADASPAEVKPYELTGTGKLFGALKPQLVINNMKGSGALKFNYESGALGTTKISSVVINGQEIQAPQYKFGSIIKNYSERVRFSAQINAAMGEVLRDNSYLVRSAASKRLLSAFGIHLNWYEKLGSKYRGLKADAADRQMLKDTTSRIQTTPDGGEKVTAVGDAADAARQAEQNCLDSSPCANKVIATNQLPSEITDSIDKSVKDITLKTPLTSVLGFANPIYGVGVPLCIVYDGSVEASGAFVNSQSAAAMKTFFSVASAADQQKKGDVTAEAVQAFNRRVGNIADSIPQKLASGQPADTSLEMSPEATKTGEFSVFDALFSGSFSTVANQIFNSFCPVATNTTVGIVTTAANAVAGILSGGGTTFTEASAETAIDTGVQKLLQSVASKVAGKFLTTEGRAAVKNTARDYAIGSGKSYAATEALSYMAKMLVLSEVGAFYSGMDSADYANQADAGGVEYAQQVGRQGFYGRPLTSAENGALAERDNQYLASQKAGQSTYQRLFALSNPTSALATLSVKIASFKLSSVASFFMSLPRMFAASFGSFSNLVFGHSFAVTPVNSTYNIVQWGWSSDEEKLIDEDSSYDPLINAKIVEDPSNQANIQQISASLGKCFTNQIGNLIQDGSVKRDAQTGDIIDQGDCSPTNLSYQSPASFAQDNYPGVSHRNDLVFRWRLDQSYQSTLNELAGIQDPVGSATGGQ